MANQNESVFASLVDLTGISAEAAKSLSTTLKIKTIADLAESPHFAFAAELTDAASNPGHVLHRFGIPLGRVVKAFETKPIEELFKAPLSALEGIGKRGERELVKAFGAKTLRELALWPPFLDARLILAQAAKDGIVAGTPKFYRISGLVVRSDGTPVVDAAVKVQRQGISKTTPLVKRDTVTTNGNGGFIVEYPRPETPTDLRVELITDRNNMIADTRPKIIGQAGVDERVRFVVGDETFRGLSTYERLERSIEHGLAGEGIKPTAITGFDQETLARLSLSTGVLPSTAVLLRQSFERAGETGLPAAILFAMGREKISIASLPALLVQDPEKRRAAVKAALAANHIPVRMEKEATKVLTKLDELTVTEALKNPAAVDITSVGTVLEGAHVSAAKRKKLADRYIRHAGTVEEFWKAVETSGDLTNAEVGRVQFELQLAVATLNHAPLSQALKTGGVAKLEDLAAFDKQGLLAVIKGTAGSPGVGLPADHKAAGTTEEEYADLIFCVVEDALPTAMVAHRAANFPDSQRLKTFLDNNAEYDLRTTPVRTYLERNPGALSFAANDGEREAITRSMKRIERAYRIAPPGARVETMETLLNDGLDSAHKVRLLGRAAFMRRYEQRLGKVQAERVFRRANNASALAEIVAARHSTAFDATPFHVLAKQSDSLKTLTFAEMFGSLDFCSCEHCQSVFAPSAYLVDVLHWLDQRNSTLPNKTVLDLLLDDRRADIAGIELSCANTNTPLPYIDIVNEVLELLVVPLQAPVNYQTTGTPADLRAHPEHLLEKAYAVVAGAEASRPAPDNKDGVYPFNLPFNLWLEEARIYLGQLGVPRYELMEALQGVDAARADRGVAIDILGMSPLEWDVITDQATASRSVAELWGLGADPNFVTTLTNVSVLLNQATPPIAEHGMEFPELVDDLRADFVQMPSALKVAFAGSTCDTENATLDGLTENHLGRLHRFIRLRRRLGWSALDLDLAIQILGAGVLDDGCLMKIAHVCRLTAALDISVAEALTGWGLMDTRRWGARLTESLTGSGFELTFDNQIKPLEKDEDASPYEKLFQNASVEVDPGDAFDINAGGDELRTLGTLSDQITPIASALGVTAEELAELLPGLARRNGQLNPTPDQLNLANLSTLYAHVSLARSLRMSMRDFRSVLELTGIDPFDVANIEASLDLVNQVHFIRDSGFSVDELNYLLRHVDTRPASLGIDDTGLGVLFFELGAALGVVEVQFPEVASSATADELREQLTQALAVVLAEGDVNEALAFIDIDPQNNQSPPATAAQFIDDKLATVLDAADAKLMLTVENDPAYKGTRRERLEYVLDSIVTRLRAAGKAAAVIERMASATGLEQSMCAPLLREHLTDPGGSNRHLLELFTDDAVRDYIKTEDDSDEPILPGPADLPDQFGAYTLLHKVAVIVNRLRINKNELDWVLRQGPTHGTLDFQSLPIVGNVASVAYSGWKRLRDAVGQRDRFSPREVFDLFEAAADPQADDTSFEALLVELERRSHWDRADIEFLVGSPARPNSPAMPGALGFTYPQDWENERPLVRLAEVMAVVRRIGLSAQIIWEWRLLPTPANGTPGAQQTAIDDQKAQSTQIKQAVRARHDASQWYEIAASLRDRLRERQRDALVGWLVGNDDRFTDANGLFAHLLLDVEMSPCQLTSRVKQAISSTQLFVQRLLMGLEVDGNGQPLVELSRAEADEWVWRKNYRVWEANRKVFLYPENWLEPELRDNKTPFFIELENELLQNEVTAETAETAVRGYLEKLDEVARLEIVGLCEQKDDDANILHVFGRTRSSPPIYYYRQQFDRTRWTPWEKVEAGIEGDHLIPVVFNRRLYVFWAIITEAALEEEQPIPSPTQLPDSAGAPNRYYEIRLAWSQRQSQGWAGKKIAAEFIGEDVSNIDGITLDIQRDVGSSTADFFFRPVVGADLVIEPIRYRRTEAAYRLYKDQKPGSGPGGIDNGDCGGFEQPPVDPGNPDPTDPDPVASGYFLLSRFRMSGCDGTVTLEQRDNESVTAIKLPPNTETVNQTFTRLTGGGGLAFPATNVTTPGSTHEPALTSAKPKFEIVPMRMDDFQSARPFFYQDQRRTFFIVPYSRNLPWIREVPEWAVNAKMKLEPMMHIAGLCERPVMPGNDPWVYDPNATVSLPPAVVVGEPVRRFAAGRSLAGRAGSAFAESLGPQVAFVSNMPAKARSTRTSLSLGARVVDANGDWIGDYCRGASYSLNLARTTMNATYVMPELKAVDVPMAPQIKSIYGTTYRFDVFYHPYLCTMMREINRYGIDGLFDPSPTGTESQLLRQQKRDDTIFGGYGPTDAVRGPRPIDDFDFSSGGAYAPYNWEIFFHVPFRVAFQLSQNQRFAEAQKWFHYIFDPTETEGAAPQRFWKVKPLFELFNDETDETGPIAELLLLLQYEGSEPEKLRMRDELIEEVAAWRAHPFSPHALARLRLSVYARSVVMKYIDNLIEWGDQLFRRDTMESVNEATQLYILASQLLGRQPRKVEREPRDPQTFANLRQAGIDDFGNALVEEIEGMLPEITETDADVYEDEVALTSGTLFFCIPPNEKLLTEYWGRVADRLFKLRHCMNIEGAVRQLRLFEPPIDPSLLVRARAAGVDLASALSDLNAPLLCYRYQLLSQKATELCADVRGLGQALLSALEKKDAETLALVRAGHQVKLEDALIDVRERQVDETKEALAALRKSKESAEIRRDYYRSRDYVNSAEALQFTLSSTAAGFDVAAVIAGALGTILSATPDYTAGGAGFGGSPVVTTTIGGTQMGNSSDSLAAKLRTAAGLSDRGAQIAGLVGGYERRSDDWSLQGDTAEKEIEALERQIVAAEIRVAIADKELANLKLQLEQSKETETFLRDKYTNVQLYQWMVGQLSSLHFQSYQLAFDLAKRAECAWQFELAIQDKTFIQFGYWDSLKKGLLAGERLNHDLKRMEVAYMESNKREYELVRHVSLRELDSTALLRLRREGECFVDIPEAWFDIATPGHYMRRIKTVALSIPSVTGPYTAVPCTLTLETNSIRTSPDSGSDYARDKNNPDQRFRDDVIGLQSIVTSQAQEDSGLFEASLRDERYLPFEGAGVISRWKLELPREFRQFDYDTISDVILHIRYTARDGGSELRIKAENELRETLRENLLASQGETGLLHILSARRDFPDEWAKFLAPPDTQTDQSLTLAIDEPLFPFPLQGSAIKIAGFELFFAIDNIDGYISGGASPVTLEVSPAGAAADDISLVSVGPNEFGGLPHGGKSFGNSTVDLGSWTITFKEADNTNAAPSIVTTTNGHRRLNTSDIRDIAIVLRYKV